MKKKDKKLHPVAELAAEKKKSKKAEGDDDKYMRLAAEFENYKRRTSKQFSSLVENANEDLILDILLVVDDFERALVTLSPDNDSKTENCDVIINGMKLIYSKLMDTLTKRGVEVMDPIGKQFDPNLHEAVMQTPSEDKEDGAVTEVVVPGYTFKNKVIRHAKVVVAVNE